MKPTEFQQASVRAVLRSFSAKGATGRFLVADEPGLGKTVVARQVLKELSENRLLTVLYVCSSQAIAAQNVEQLLGDLPGRDTARGSADRPGLLALDKTPPTHERLRVYSLTPGSAFATGKRPSRGRVQERAFACALLEHEAGENLDTLRTYLSWETRQFETLVLQYRSEIRERLAARNRASAPLGPFVSDFRRLLVECLPGQAGRGSYGKLLNAAAQWDVKKARGWVTALSRNCLAAASLNQLEPGLVIFDEFQRFRDMTSDDLTGQDAAETAIRSLLTARQTGKLLMLSATPYEALRSAARPVRPVATGRRKGKPAKRKDADQAEGDFYKLLRFLWGNRPASERMRAVQSVREGFGARETEIRRGEPDSAVAKAALESLESTLSQVMCRTERPVPEHVAPEKDRHITPLVTTDVASFRSFVNWVGRGKNSQWTVPLWSSVPLAAQVLGKRYVLWKDAPDLMPRGELQRAQLKKWILPRWNNPKARGFLQMLPPKALSAPWVRATCEWWPNGGVWAREPSDTAIDGKTLVFSRFAAVPGALSAVVSYNLEAQLYQGMIAARRPNFEEGAKPAFTRASLRPAMFSLFFASEFLAAIDPLTKGVPGTLAQARRVVASQLKKALVQRGIEVAKDLTRKPVPVQAWLIHLACPDPKQVHPAQSAWVDAVTTVKANSVTPAAALRGFQQLRSKLSAKTMKKMTPQEFSELAALALRSPAVVMARAAMRHWREDDTPLGWDDTVLFEGRKGVLEKVRPRQELQRLAIHGLRTYLDRTWFAAALKRRAHETFPNALYQAVVDGNLESVLDEHFWFVSATNSQPWTKRLRELRDALALNGGRTLLHEKDKSKEKRTAVAIGRKDGPRQSRIRCNVAVPLHQAKEDNNATDEQDVPRPDSVRHAFNTPFWPMVLTTTSIGQEGLDFHPWCKTVAHWDPAPGPVELEQREGRISRFAGLSIRRAIGPKYAPQLKPHAGSPWSRVACLASQAAALEDTSGGMSPWWCTEGASTTQLYLHCAGSREATQRIKLERRRAVYRMVLGASEPEWLMEELDATRPPSLKDVVENSLELGAWRLEQRKKVSE